MCTARNDLWIHREELCTTGRQDLHSEVAGFESIGPRASALDKELKEGLEGAFSEASVSPALSVLGESSFTPHVTGFVDQFLKPF